MPQEFRRKSSDDYDAINPDFPPPSLKPPDDGRELEKKKKKDKKWSIGGLFRRKKKVSDTDSSSPIEDDEEKKGFLERRRAARKKRNRGSKDVTGSFEHVRMTHPAQAFEGMSSHQREFREITNDRLVGRSHESLTKRHQENQVRGSSASLEGVGRKGSRIQVKARAEANREMLRIESSSDEGCESSRHSSSSVPRGRGEDMSGSKDGSLSRRSRAARNERYKKRFSKDEESLKDFQMGSASRICRSDEKLTSKSKMSEKAPVSNRWTAKVVYYESSDYDTKYTAKTKSATPSPLQSPKARPKNPLHFTASAPPATNYVTYPPSHMREGVAGSHQELRSQNFPSLRAHGLKKSNQRYPDVTPPRLPKSSSDMITNLPCPGKLQSQSCNNQDLLKRKSASYDCHVNHLHFVNSQISKPHPTDENVLVVQFPISRPCHLQDSMNTKVGVPSHDTTKQQNPPPPPPRDPHRRLMTSNGYHESSSRPMSYAFEERSSQQLKHQTFPEFGSKVSAFHRVPQTAPIDIQPTNSINFHHRSNSDHHIPNRINSLKMSPPMTRRPSSVQQDIMITKQYAASSDTFGSSPPSDFSQGSVPQHYQYYTDQQPRSRKPIHIACQSQNPQNDQYASDTQVAVKPPVQQSPRARPSAVQNATEFWKQKDQECVKKVHLSEGSPKLIQRHLFNVVNENSRTNSLTKSDKSLNTKSKLTPLTMPSRGTDSSGSISSQSSPRDNTSPRSPSGRVLVHNEIGIPVFDGFDLNAVSKREFRPLSMLEEKTETSELEISPLRERVNNPPLPPTRRNSKFNPVTNFEHHDISINGNDSKESRRKSNNLEEALNELEAIYKSLRMGEDDHEEKVSKEKAVYENNRLDPSNWNAWVQSRGFESDSSFNYSRSSLESVDSIDSPIKRTSKSRQLVVPDKVADDMAFRKLNKKEKPPPHEQEVIAQAGSFLLVSPTLSPPPFLESIPSPPVKNEPDITLDDVVYRNIKHVNNTLKVLDPQPPFGIPLGPVTPAPNSDYLHVTPKDVYRPTFKPRKTPDVVTDDLAFRNLRKDSNKEPQFSPEDTTLLDLPTIKKKRAVRSLSANLLSIIQKESMTYKNNNNLLYNNNVVSNDLEKSRSFTDIVDSVNTNGFTSKSQLLEQKQFSNNFKSKVNVSGDESDATPRASIYFHSGTSSPLISTSTETLTESKVTLLSQEPQRFSHSKVSHNSKSKFFSTPERRHTTEIANPFKRSADLPIKHVPIKLEPLKINYFVDPTPKLPDFQRCSTPDKHMTTHNIDSQETQSLTECNQTESDLLSILAREAKEASEQLSKELNELDLDETIKPIMHPKNNSVNSTQISGHDMPKDLSLFQNPSKPISIGKITPHKPVKLNTFRITEDNKLENKQTEINLESKEIESSKSMTDLLKELTRSLDFDFGSAGSENENTPTKEVEEKGNETELDIDRDTDYPIETTEQETFSEAIEPRDNKETEENYFSSVEEVPDRSLSSPELSLLRSLSEMSPEESAETVQKVIPVKHSFPLVLPEENVIEGLTTPTTSHQQLTELPRGGSPGGAGSSDATRCGGSDSSVSRAPAPGCSSSRDSTVVGCSADCSNMTDEGIKSVSHVLDLSSLFVVCMALAHQCAGLDFLTILGLVLAMASLILFLLI